DGMAGLLCRPEDPRALAAAIESVLRDRPLAERLRERSTELARHHDWPIVADRYVELYRSVLAKRSA
ncbi:MAG: glycosyltransferase, partial [Planctomycetaceae bacterium]